MESTIALLGPPGCGNSERRLLRRVDGARDANAVQAGVRAALE